MDWKTLTAILLGGTGIGVGVYYLVKKEEGPCTESDMKCIGYDRYICQGGQWILYEVNSPDCGYVPDCTEGNMKCIGFDRYICQNQQWVLHEANSLACGYVCADGEFKCIGYDRYICQSQRWVLHEANSTDCGFGKYDLELVDAWFDERNPMTKKPGDTFTVNLEIKNNLDKEWSPSHINFGFQQGGAYKWIVWGRNFITGEVDPYSCWHLGYWPLGAWPIIPAGGTQVFQATYGFCPRAAEGTYDGIISMGGSTQNIVIPDILAIRYAEPDIILQSAVLGPSCWGQRQYGGYAVFGVIDITIQNNGGLIPKNDVDLQITLLAGGGQAGFVRFGRDIPSGITTLTLDRSERGWGVSEVTLSPDTLNYTIDANLKLRWPGKPSVHKTFSGTTTLGIC